jgi:hypothetical protein
MAKKKHAPSPKTADTKIPPEQMDLPVSFDAEGNPMTLRDVMRLGLGSVLSLASISPEKRAELTVRRIEAQPEFELAMVGGGIVSKERAIQEVKAQSDIGKVVTEIEQRLISNLLEQLDK